MGKWTNALLILLCSIACVLPTQLHGQQPAATESKSQIVPVRAAKPARSDADRGSKADTLVRPTVRPNIYGEDSPALVRLRKTLAAPVRFEFNDKSIRGAIDELGKMMDITIQFDTKALGDAGVDVDSETVSIHAKEMVLGAALDNMFTNRNLAWVIGDEVLLITTPDALESMKETRIFDVTDLVSRTTKTGQVQSNFEPLQEAILNGVPGPWEEVNGEGGTILPLESEGIYVLVVLNNPRCHDRVEAFLRALRSMRHGSVDLKELQKKSQPLNLPQHSALDREVSRISPVTRQELSLTEDVGQSGNQFAGNLYGELASRSRGNLFVSPFSISTAMSMVYGGARERTAQQMREVLQLTLPDDEVHAHLRLLQRHLMPGLKSAKYKLHVANGLWGQEGFEILDSFLALTKDNYHAEMALVDFVGNKPAALATINDWVKQQTAGLIPALVNPADIDNYTRLVLANAVYFEARWKENFPEQATKPADFQTFEKTIQTPTMHQLARFRYAEVDKTQILEMNYEGDELSMLILLPPKGANNLAAAEKLMTQDEIKKWHADLEENRVNVHMPKFQFRSRFDDLKETLSAMGVVDAFDVHDADFSGINGHKGDDPEAIYLRKVIHEAFVEVDEKGTKAAAATAFVGGFGGGPARREPEPVDFIADHPFVFLIRENETGCILFMGRVVNPNES